MPGHQRLTLSNQRLGRLDAGPELGQRLVDRLTGPRPPAQIAQTRLNGMTVADQTTRDVLVTGEFHAQSKV
jgi:hypothetical protein